MKKFLAILVTICLITSVLCVAAVPASAAGGLNIIVCGLSSDGLMWGIGIYDDFEDAWNEAIYYATHLDEAWNSSERYESEEDRPAVEGFERIVVDFYDDWNADSNDSFGSGIGFKDGSIYVPNDAKITVNLGGHTIKRGLTGHSKAVYIDAGADVEIYNGTVIGGIHADKNAKAAIKNVNVTGNTVTFGNGSARYASIFGEGSFAMIVSLLTLVVSIACMGITLSLKKKLDSVVTNNTKPMPKNH